MKILLELENLGDHKIVLKNQNGDSLTVLNEEAIDFFIISKPIDEASITKHVDSDAESTSELD